MSSDYLTLEEASDRLGVDYKTIYRLVRRGELPAAKIGRIYRIRVDDLNAYFERQKQLVSTSTGSTVGAVNCAACGIPLISSLSVGGRCEETGREICQACWSIKKIRRCPTAAKATESQADDKDTKRRDTPGKGASTPVVDVQQRIDELRAQGKPVITPREAAKLEELFLHNFGERLNTVEELPDPLSQRSVVLRDARVKHHLQTPVRQEADMPANHVSRFSLRVGGWGRPKSCLVLEARFISRPQTLKQQRYDADPVTEEEILEFVRPVVAQAKTQSCFHLIVIGSPTGWTDGAVRMFTSGGHTRAFEDRHVAIVLHDLSTNRERVLFNESDERFKAFWPVVAPLRYAGEFQRCRDAVLAELGRRNSLALADAVRLTAAHPAWVSNVFKDIVRREPDRFTVDDLAKVGLVISRISS